MSMFGSAPANDVETRLYQLEQKTPSMEVPAVQVTVDSSGATPVPVMTDPIDYNAPAWESYSTFTAAVSATGVPSGTWSGGTEGYLQPQAYRIGNVIFLAGLIKRRTTAVPPDFAANAQMNSIMFRLPYMWRPVRTVMLTCSCDTSGVPSAATGAGRALLMVTPNLTQDAGLVTLVTASVAMNGGTSWVSLEGSFPGMFTCDMAEHLP